MMLVANFARYKILQKTWKMTKSHANGYSSESTQQELSNEYQHDRVWMVFKNIFVIVLWTKVALSLEGLRKKFDIRIIKNLVMTWI